MYTEKNDFNNENIERDPIYEYLIEKNKALAQDYCLPNKGGLESCGEIAFDIAKILISQGKKPEVLSIVGKAVGNNNEALKPVQYEGRITWGKHLVCYSDGLVYDPLIDHPLPLDEYIREVFNQEVEIAIEIPPDKIETYINR